MGWGKAVGMSADLAAVTHVIHQLDADGRVLRIGWETASSTQERQHLVAQTRALIDSVSYALSLIDFPRIPDEATPVERAAIIQAHKLLMTSQEVAVLRERIGDARMFLPAMARLANGGLSFPQGEAATLDRLSAPPQQAQRRTG